MESYDSIRKTILLTELDGPRNQTSQAELKINIVNRARRPQQTARAGQKANGKVRQDGLRKEGLTSVGEFCIRAVTSVRNSELRGERKNYARL